MTIVEFLEARFAEDEAVALKAGGAEAEWLYRAEYDNETGNEAVWANSRTEEWMGPAQKQPYVSYGRNVTMDHEGCLPAVDEDDGPHIARHDPARILREVAAKRAIIAPHRFVSWLVPDDEDANGACVQCSKVWNEENHLAIVGWPCEPLRALAVVHSSHPDYQKEWAL